MTHNKDLWHVVKSLNNERGGGVAKAVQITVFFDDKGNLVGKTDCQVVRIMPGRAMDMVKLLFSGRGEN